MECEYHGDPSKVDRKVIRDVNTIGWHVMVVTPQGANPGWAYSIGLHHNYKHPEILVFGLSGDTMHRLVNHVGREARGGARFQVDTEYSGILERYGCTFRTVGTSWYRPVLGYATWFYKGHAFPTLQLFWPDRAQRYPWAPGFDPELVKCQPLLFRKNPREARAEELLASVRRGPQDP